MSASVPGEAFVWRYLIDEKQADDHFEDPLLELLRVQWLELLRLCIPTYHGVPVKIDGFTLLRDLNRTWSIYGDDELDDEAQSGT